MMAVVLDAGVDWRAVAAIAGGAGLRLSVRARGRIETASTIVGAIVAGGGRAYGVNTGVGALSDTVVDRPSQGRLSRHIVMSHACGVGPLLGLPQVRAIIAAQIANFAHGHSGVRGAIVEALLALLEHNCIPDVPAQGSIGYLTHSAHIALVLLGEGQVTLKDRPMPAADALAAIGIAPIVLQAKEGLSLVNGTAGATGLACIALSRIEHLLDWADAIAAMTLEALGCQIGAFAPAVLALRQSDGLQAVGQSLRAWLAGSGLVDAAAGRRTQDALSLRAIPHAHGAARDVFGFAAAVVDRELASVTDNPALAGTPDQPLVWSQAHAMAPALGQVMDSLAIALAQIAAMSERRIDRLVNPLVNGLSPFLAADPGASSGFMIAQYTALALSSENRRLAVPASLDGGVTSALQEDFLTHQTSAASKLLALLDNAEQIFGIELAVAAQAHDQLAARGAGTRAAGTDALYRLVRARLPSYADDRPLSGDLIAARDLVLGTLPALPAGLAR